MTVLGKFSVVMADPPWDIHMEVHTVFRYSTIVLLLIHSITCSLAHTLTHAWTHARTYAWIHSFK